MEDNSQIIYFHGPEGAVTLNVNIYKLEDGENWSDLGVGVILIVREREPIKLLTGTFPMKIWMRYMV